MRLELQIPDDLAEDLARFKPRTLSLPMFCAYLLEIGIDRDARVSAYHVGAGHTGNLTTEQIQPTPAQQGISGLQAVESSAPENSSSSQSLFGDGVGRESEGGGRKGGKQERLIPPSVQRNHVTKERVLRENLSQHETLIREFWRVKKGSKSDSAWSLLQTELTKIQAVHGDARVQEQLELAVNGLWKGITLRNFERFETPSKTAAKEPERRHPASRVFTADRGFEDGPTTNPALEGLF